MELDNSPKMIAKGKHDDCRGQDYDSNADRQARAARAAFPFLEYDRQQIAEQYQHDHVNGPTAEGVLRPKVDVSKVIEEELPIPKCAGQHGQQVVPPNTP